MSVVGARIFIILVKENVWLTVDGCSKYKYEGLMPFTRAIGFNLSMDDLVMECT